MMVVRSYSVERAQVKLPVNERIQDLEDHHSMKAIRGDGRLC